MITWMQHHRKYLVITIWISTIAFVGAGFVGWGQYSYGDKAGAVAKIGEVPVSMREFQQSYSRLYGQYNQMFQGNFDEAQAKSFGLQKQALRQLIDQALIINLANSYNLLVTDRELLNNIEKQDIFFENGKFSKEIYKKALGQNNLTMREYEDDVRKAMLIQKTLTLFPTDVLELETQSVQKALFIADKIEYKVLTPDMIKLDTSDEKLKPFWETRQQNYMTLPSYYVEVITQPNVDTQSDETTLREYYQSNKSDFFDEQGVLLTFDQAQNQLHTAINDKTTNKEALRTYIAYKKNKLDSAFVAENMTLDSENMWVNDEIFAEIQSLNSDKPYLKPRKVNDSYVIIKLVSVNPSQVKTFEAARAAVLSQYTKEETNRQLLAMAKSTVKTFQGKTTDFLTRTDVNAIEGLDETEASEFLNVLFEQTSPRGVAGLQSNVIVLYNIIEQKFTESAQMDATETIVRLKSAMLDRGLITLLNNKYKTEIFLEGL